MIPRPVGLVAGVSLQFARLVYRLVAKGGIDLPNSGDQNEATTLLSSIARLRSAVTEHANQVLVRRVVDEAFNAGNLAVIGQVGAQDLCVHYPQAGAPLCGLDQVKRAFSQSRAAFPDAYFMIEDTIAAGDRIVNRWTGRATHTGTFWGMPPTGRLMTLTGVTIYRLVGGKVAEIWVHIDTLSLLQQLESDSKQGRSSG